MKKLFMFSFFLVIGSFALEAQTTKCNITAEECAKICATNPACAKTKKCTPADCAALVQKKAEPSSTKAVLAAEATKVSSCIKATKSSCVKMAAKNEKALSTLASNELPAKQ